MMQVRVTNCFSKVKPGAKRWQYFVIEREFFKLLPSMRFRDGQAASGAPGVVKGGDNGENGGGIEGEGTQHYQRHPGKYLAKQDGEEREDLRAGAGFAVNTRAEIAHAQADVEEGRDDENTQIAAEHQDGDAAGYELLMHQHQEQGAEQELVGHGVEVLANLGLLLKQPSGEAIQAVTEAGDDKKPQRGLVMRLQDGDDQEGYKAQAQERKQIGRCA
jgi:hypothetical protein